MKMCLRRLSLRGLSFRPMLKQTLTHKVTKWQIERQRQFRSIPECGVWVDYCGKSFLVSKDVFIPFMDSHLLIENFNINPGDKVLDVGTGCGNLAVFAVDKGAARVVAVDINLNALKAVQLNTNLHGFSGIIDVRQSDIFSHVKTGELFDVMLVNLPIRNKKATDLVEVSMWDTDLRANRDFISKAGKYLADNGRIYLAQANFGAVEEILRLARRVGFKIRLVGQKQKTAEEIFYAFELRVK